MIGWDGHVDGPFRLENDIELRGRVFHEVIVPSGVTLILHGTACADVIVEKGGRATIHGTIAGCLINLGGDVEVFGQVEVLADAPGVRTTLRNGAAVRQR